VSTRVDTVGLVEQTSRLAIAPSPQLDSESRRWLDTLRAVDPATRDEAVAALHALLLRAARFELSRRRAALSHLRGEELDDVATQAADDALVSVLPRLEDFRGASRFTTWAYKFALYEAAVKLRKRAWQGREVPLEPETGASSRAPGRSRTPRPNNASWSRRSRRRSRPCSRRTSAGCSWRWP
jgi:DNA-directed RNA polymerase specialized sigma24 family protein